MRKVWLVAAVAVVLSTTACQQGSPSGTGPTVSPAQSQVASTQTEQSAPAQTAAVEPVGFQITPAGDSSRVRLDAPVTIKVSKGTLSKVTVTDDGGNPLRGSLADDKTAWHNDASLKGDATYTVTAVGVSSDGKEQTTTASFKTLSPSARVSASIYPLNGWTVGAGLPVSVNFTKPVATANRAATLKALSVTTSPTQVWGAWRWMTDSQVQWRPAQYWPAGTKVTVKADLAGVEVRTGVWGKGVATSAFTIGVQMISTVDIKKHTLTVRQNGAVIKVIPITTGKAGFDTRGGIKIISSREPSRRMDAETTGIAKTNPEYYNIADVKWAMRLTNSGEFLHAAPWSVGSQGKANVSHGCTGMSTANAKWLYDHSKVGDVVQYINAKRQPEWGNGYTAWNISFAQWQSGKAL